MEEGMLATQSTDSLSINSTPPTPPVIPALKPKRNVLLLVIGGIVILGVVIAIVIGLVLLKFPSKKVTSFEECVKAKGSSIQESNPPTCVTFKGLSFKESTSSVVPSPFEPLTGSTANWKTYTSSKYNFSFKYPPSFGNQGLIAGPFTGKSEFLQTFSDPLTIREGTDAPFDGFSLYAVMDMKTDSFDQYLRNELKIMNENEFSRMQGARQQPFSGGTALVTNTLGYYYLRTPDKQKLVVFVYLQANASFKPTFDQILSTFKFTIVKCTDVCPQYMPPAPNFCTNGTIISGGKNECGCPLPPTCEPFTCPANGWANCMPMLSDEGKRACSAEAMAWYNTNCPNFQGAAR